jgi:Skp family chaperone for outer membrane proteins
MIKTALFPMEGVMHFLQQVFSNQKHVLVASASMIALSLSVLSTPANAADKTASQMSVKIGYFNQNLVKMADPEAAGSDSLKNQAESQLRRDVDEGNKKVQKARDEKKSADEITKMVEQLQIEISAKQQALAQLVQNNNAIAQDRLRQVIAAVAKDRGLDLVVDGAGVFAGGKSVLDNGVDVTDEIVRKLNPNGSAKK